MFEHVKLGQKSLLFVLIAKNQKNIQVFVGYAQKKAPENWGPSLNIKHK
jgi:hypothetical protein